LLDSTELLLRLLLLVSAKSWLGPTPDHLQVACFSPKRVIRMTTTRRTSVFTKRLFDGIGVSLSTSTFLVQLLKLVF
jgi:hypothetical protein